RDYTIQQPIVGNVRFEKVSFHYPSRPETLVLDDVTFSVDAGQKLALVGPSGAGKSTIASLLLHFYQPTSGKVYFDDKSAGDYRLMDIRQQIAVVPQDVMLFSGSIRENIGYGRLGASDEEIITAAKQANAHEFIAGFPDGYDTLVGERGVKLSGGQRQRIAI